MELGSDTEQLRAWADRARQGGEHLEGRLAELESMILVVPWEGADAEGFRAEWSAVRGRAFSQVARLRADATEVDGHAEEQDHASSVDGAGGGSGAGAGGEDRPGWTWPWDDQGSWPWQGDVDLRDDIPIDDPDEYGLDAMNQGRSGNCMVVATLGALSEKDPQFFMDHIEQTGPETYEVTLYDHDGEPVVYTVDGEIAKGAMTGADGQQNWMSLYEDALIQHGMLDESGEYSDSYSGSSMQQAITGAESEYYLVGNIGRSGVDRLSDQQLVEEIDSGGTVMLGTYDDSADANGREMVENHAYVIESVNDDGTVTVVNPWGEDALYWFNGDYRTDIPIEEIGEHFDTAWVSTSSEEWGEQQ